MINNSLLMMHFGSKRYSLNVLSEKNTKIALHYEKQYIIKILKKYGKNG